MAMKRAVRRKKAAAPAQEALPPSFREVTVGPETRGLLCERYDGTEACVRALAVEAGLPRNIVRRVVNVPYVQPIEVWAREHKLIMLRDEAEPTNDELLALERELRDEQRGQSA